MSVGQRPSRTLCGEFAHDCPDNLVDPLLLLRVIGRHLFLGDAPRDLDDLWRDATELGLEAT